MRNPALRNQSGIFCFLCVMKKLYFLLFSIYIQQLSAQQVGHTQVTFTDAARTNRQIQTEVYYPAATAGDNVPISSGTFPLIVFGHGFVMAWNSYQNFWDDLVPAGYILAFPTTEGTFSPVHQDFGDDLKFLITEIQTSGAGASVPSGSVGITSAIMGHSMGGGSSFLAAKNNSSITTMISFAAANTNPSSIVAAQNVTVPTLLFSGVNDCVAPPAAHQDSMYVACTAAYKTQVYVTGGGHCYFANNNFNCSFGEGTCTPNPTITRTEQQDVTSDLLKLWLEYYLKGLCPKAQEFQDSLLLSNRITYRQSQSIACANGVNELTNSISVSVFPNPAGDFISVSLEKENVQSVRVFDLLMGEQSRFTVDQLTTTTQLNISNLPSGTYFIRINDSLWNKFCKK